MKKKIILAAFAASLVPGVALAGTPGSSNSVTQKMTGKSATAYSDVVFGDTTCNETQHPKFDTVACTLSSANLGLAGTSGTVGWYSDFDNSKLGTFAYTVSADGLSYYGQATYTH
jgi:hypothetical protein